MTPCSIAAINQLRESQKREIFSRFIPPQLLEQFEIGSSLEDEQGRPLAKFRYRAGSTDFAIDLRHEFDAKDPLFFAHLTDTMNGQIHVLLYIVNDPHSERFDVDRMPDGRQTQFGLELRNLQAERAAMLAGLALPPFVSSQMPNPFAAEAGQFTTELQTNRTRESPCISASEITRLSNHSPTRSGSPNSLGRAVDPPILVRFHLIQFL